MSNDTKFQDELKGRAELMAIESGLCPEVKTGTYDTANFEKFWCLWKHDSRIWLADMHERAEKNKRTFFLAGLSTGLAVSAITLALIRLAPELTQLLSR